METDKNKVIFEISGNIAYVTLNNPDRHNAFDDGIIADLTGIFNDIAVNPDIRAMVLASNGKNFSAGADLNWMRRMAGYSYQENLRDANALAVMLKALNFLPQLTIAKVQGAAFGGAVGLASCCDIVLADKQARFCLSEVKLGLIPATISPYVINAIGAKACRRYFQTAERFSAYKAMQLGLVNEVVELDLLDDTCDNLLEKMMNNGPEAVKQAKQLIFDVTGKEMDGHLLRETSERIAAIRVSEQGQEGLSAFFEQRAANW
ncbi:enoyl-CoA hydratase/isomerase family protein [Thalassomonas viridans]|uniref:Enoyl-CoA hydratase/isomerase family protein n=1 Tax=Thalassomonas viridans TaxID=137584 RepID=A0AAE9Z3V8_9GAMM|nr:enoyl-CoA hydratase/isomerase family protein [Thalassomonas viridans]WDE06078.1 enoyl-CoA hydratase/isomerase family protein [Thalassomonas viridans]